MKPAQFVYNRARSLEEVFAALKLHGPEAKLIAGGQSLVPMLNFRLLRPSLLIDINRVPELQRLEETPEGGLRIGALTRHHQLRSSPLVKRLYPVLHEAMGHVAHLAIRHRGSIGGSLSHADPAAELPMMAVLLDARLKIASAAGRRELPAAEFFQAALMTALEPQEVLVEIELPPLPAGTGWAFEEVARRAGDFALAAAGVLLRVEDGRVREPRIAVMGVGEVPSRLSAAEQALAGQALDEQTLEAVVAQVRAAVEPTTDLHASADYRRHLVGVLVRRAIAAAWQRATGESA